MSNINREIVSNIVDALVPFDTCSVHNIEQLKNDVKNDMCSKTPEEMFDALVDVLSANSKDFGPSPGQSMADFKNEVRNHLLKKSKEEVEEFLLQLSLLTNQVLNSMPIQTKVISEV